MTGTLIYDFPTTVKQFVYPFSYHSRGLETVYERRGECGSSLESRLCMVGGASLSLALLCEVQDRIPSL